MNCPVCSSHIQESNEGFFYCKNEIRDRSEVTKIYGCVPLHYQKNKDREFIIIDKYKIHISKTGSIISVFKNGWIISEIVLPFSFKANQVNTIDKIKKILSLA